MRDIKFRAWDKEEKLMIENGSFDGSIPLGDKDLIFMQYTGLKDKKGKEIYEGDILLHNNSYVKSKYVVKWMPNQAGFNITNKYLDDQSIVGNIYENLKLLEAK